VKVRERTGYSPARAGIGHVERLGGRPPKGIAATSDAGGARQSLLLPVSFAEPPDLSAKDKARLPATMLVEPEPAATKFPPIPYQRSLPLISQSRVTLARVSKTTTICGI